MLPPLFALFAFPVIMLIALRHTDLPRAILICIVTGYLLLPEKTAFDVPGLPALDKHTVPALTALLLLGLSAASGSTVLTGILPRSRLVRLFLVMLIGGTFLTVLTNGDPLTYGSLVLPGIRPYDGFSFALSILMVILPMLLARKYLATPSAHRLFLKVLCIAALAYSLLAMVELRMSPQMNNWIYGFFQHSFIQHVRAGGYRPVVFLSHGLMLAIFLNAAVLAAIGLARQGGETRTPYIFAALWLLVTLVLSKSLGALLITILLGAAACFLRSRAQLIVAAVAAAMVLLYPMARSSDIMPVDQIVELAESIDTSRAASLEFRIKNENAMLAKAEERPLFGWGGWGRSRVYSPSGEDVTTADGYWVIVFGVGGWTRYISEFGLLAMPLILLLIHARRKKIGMETSILALIMAGNMIDLLPNASVTPLSWLMAGALWGRLELGAEDRAKDGSPGDATSMAGAAPGYRRGVKSADPPDTVPEHGQTVTDIAGTKPGEVAYTRQRKRIDRPPRELRQR